MLIQAKNLRDRGAVRRTMLQADPTADVWQHDGGDLLIGEIPFSDEDDLTDEDHEWTWAGTVADFLRNIPEVL